MADNDWGIITLPEEDDSWGIIPDDWDLIPHSEIQEAQKSFEKTIHISELENVPDPSYYAHQKTTMTNSLKHASFSALFNPA